MVFSDSVSYMLSFGMLVFICSDRGTSFISSLSAYSLNFLISLIICKETGQCEPYNGKQKSLHCIPVLQDALHSIHTLSTVNNAILHMNDYFISNAI